MAGTSAAQNGADRKGSTAPASSVRRLQRGLVEHGVIEIVACDGFEQIGGKLRRTAADGGRARCQARQRLTAQVDRALVAEYQLFVPPQADARGRAADGQ